MQETGGSITSVSGGVTTEAMLFTYDENERQEQMLNKMNSELVLNPKFIPVYPKMLQDGYSAVECLLFGFIDFFLSNNDKFYCTDDQLSKMLNVGVATIGRGIKKLSEEGIIKVAHKIRAGGGKIRFISLQRSNCNVSSHQNDGLEKSKGLNIYNNIIENKIIDNNQIKNNQNDDSGIDDLFNQFMMHYPKKGKRDVVRSAFNKLSGLDKEMVVRDAIIEKWMLFYGLKELRYEKNPVVFLEEYSYSEVGTLTNVRAIVTPLRHKEQSEEELAVRKKCFHEIGMDIINPIWKSMNKKVGFVFHDE